MTSEERYREILAERLKGLTVYELEGFLAWFRQQAVKDGENPDLIDEIIDDCRKMKAEERG